MEENEKKFREAAKTVKEILEPLIKLAMAHDANKVSPRDIGRLTGFMLGAIDIEKVNINDPIGTSSTQHNDQN